MFDEPELTLGSGKLARRAIVSLIRVMYDPRVDRDKLKAYSLIFHPAVVQISALQPYKDVHDLLLKVERGCYKRLIVDAQSLTDTDMARTNMKAQLGNLKIYVADATRIASIDVERRDQIVMVREHLELAYAALLDAERLLTLDHCETALKLLKDVLVRTSHFNTLLNDVARNLKGNKLVAAMQSLQEIILDTELSSTVVKDLQLGIDDLKQLEEELQLQIDEHNNWQQLDDYLPTFSVNTPRLLNELEKKEFWKILKDRVAKACNLPQASAKSPADETTSDWVDLIIPEDKPDTAVLILVKLKKAQKRGDWKTASCDFGDLIQHTRDSLDSADRQLRGVCERLMEVRDPLRTLVEILR